MITDFHAKDYAYELSRIGGAGVNRVGRALFDACVDLNPHQIEALSQRMKQKTKVTTLFTIYWKVVLIEEEYLKRMWSTEEV